VLTTVTLVEDLGLARPRRLNPRQWAPGLRETPTHSASGSTEAPLAWIRARSADKGRRGRQATVSDTEVEALAQRRGARVGRRRHGNRDAEEALLASTPSSSSEEAGGPEARSRPSLGTPAAQEGPSHRVCVWTNQHSPAISTTRVASCAEDHEKIRTLQYDNSRIAIRYARQPTPPRASSRSFLRSGRDGCAARDPLSTSVQMWTRLSVGTRYVRRPTPRSGMKTVSQVRAQWMRREGSPLLTRMQMRACV